MCVCVCVCVYGGGGFGWWAYAKGTVNRGMIRGATANRLRWEYGSGMSRVVRGTLGAWGHDGKTLAVVEGVFGVRVHWVTYP